MSAVKGADGPVFGGIDIGGTSIKWMIVDEAGAILTQGSEPTRCEAVAEQVGGIGSRLAHAYPGLVGVGLICPGLVDEDNGTVVYAANLELRGVQLARAVEEATGIPAALMHDGRAAGLAEGLLGAGRGASSFLMMPIGTGISVALMLGDACGAARLSAPERSGMRPSSPGESHAGAARAGVWRSTPPRRASHADTSRQPARISAPRPSRKQLAPTLWPPKCGGPPCGLSPSR